MRAKDYLKQLERVDLRISQKIDELAELRSKALSIKSVNFGNEMVCSSSSTEAAFIHPLSNALILEAEISTELDSFIQLKHKIINEIQGLKDARYINILYKRYVDFIKLEDIASAMNYTYQYTVELHGKALQAFQITYKNLLKTYVET